MEWFNKNAYHLYSNKGINFITEENFTPWKIYFNNFYSLIENNANFSFLDHTNFSLFAN